MRKTLVVGALLVSSVLLLQTPAWAPNLYSATQITSQQPSSTDATANSATVKAMSDCYSKSVKIVFEWGEFKVLTSKADGDITFKLNHIPRNNGEVTGQDVTVATCAGAQMNLLPFTGAATIPLLAFGVSLLVAGILLLLLSRRQGRPVPRR